jgi:hypothetical protein
MVDVTYQMLLGTLQTVGILVGIFYYIMALKNQEKTRHASLFMSVYQTINTDRGIDSDFKASKIEYKTHEDWEKIANDPELFKAWAYQSNFFESLGVLVRDGLIDIEMLARLHSGSILFYWEKYKDGIMASREAMNWPRWMIETEYLVDRTVEFSRSHPELKIKLPDQYVTDKRKAT